MSDLKKKLLKIGSKLTSDLEKSDIYNREDFARTPVPAINLLLSGEIDRGVSSGLTVFAGESRTFKTTFCLLCAKSWMEKNKDGILLFYDSEFGSPPAYFKSLGIDLSRVVHIPVTDYEELKFDIRQKVDAIDEQTDRVMIMIDSLGNLASKKEAADALNENSAADMTRAKESKSLFRIITPYLKIKNIPLFAIQHVYSEMGLYPRKILAGGQGTMLAADNVFIIGKKQDKEGTEVKGYHFVINVEKSRFIRDKTKIDITVSFEGGIKRWSGMTELALEGNYIAENSKMLYCLVNQETGELDTSVTFKKKNAINEDEIWKKIFKETDFADYLTKKYKLDQKQLIDDSNEEDED